MASMRDIKRRIKSVQSTQQITKAMNLVAASKLQKAKAHMESTRPFFNETKRVITSIIQNSKGIEHPFLTVSQETKGVAVIIITSDRGLCGGYNSNINKEAFLLLQQKTNENLIVIGNKGREYFKRRNKNIVKTISGISEQPIYEDAVEVGAIALDLFTKGDVSEVYIAYTEFQSTIVHVPKVERILPIDSSAFEAESTDNGSAQMAYEPSAEAVLGYVIPKYINTVIFGALVESSACEQGARMTSMDAATENGSEMIDSLTLIYNRARQGAITQEITEIVSGANALE